MIRAFALAVLAVICLGTAWTSPSPAAAETIVESSAVENGYPRNLTFKLTARADSDIVDITLSYRLVGRGTSALGKPTEITPSTNLSTEVVVQVNSGSSYIPVGSEFIYAWEITTADGETYRSPEQTFFFLPPDQDWQSVENELMVIYYHGDKEALANRYLTAGMETLDKVATDLFGIELQQLPVKVIIFDDERESDLARPGAGQGTFDAAVTTCGTKVTNDILLMIPVSCGTGDLTDTMRHELGHIINETAGEGAIAKLPSWIDEGTAVYAQTEPGDNYVGAFESAARGNRLIPFSQMGTPSNDAGRVNLFYGQSYAMVQYLIDKGGPSQYAEFFATIKSGKRFDAALEEVYGFDLAGFEEEFVAASGGTAPAPTAAPTRQQQTQPTAAPTTRPAQSDPTARPTAVPAGRSGSGDDDGIDRVAVGVIGLAVLFALLGVFSFLLANILGNNRRTAIGPGSNPPPPPPPVDWNGKDDE